jgi:hypothetical protein
MASNRAFVRGELLYELSASDLPRVVLLSARIPHAMQSVPMLVRDHVEKGVIDGAASAAWSPPCHSHGSTTVGDGGMVATKHNTVTDRTRARDQGKGCE